MRKHRSYIVHIYRQQANLTAGTVQDVRSGRVVSFRCMEELWQAIRRTPPGPETVRPPSPRHSRCGGCLIIQQGGERAVNHGIRITFALAIALGCCANVRAAEAIPKAGTIEFHTGWKVTANTVTPAEKYSLGNGGVSGVTFNNEGSGPLHLGPANCVGTFFIKDGKAKDKGFCAFGDAEGDRLFTEYTGIFDAEGANGINEIIGGTGKYAGATGSGPYRCKMMGNNGELQCAQRLDYKLQ